MLLRRLSLIATAAMLVAVLFPGAAAAESGAASAASPASSALGDATVWRYAADTYRSLEAMVFPSGLPTDNIDATTMVRAQETSPTNIGAWIWSTISARDLGLISPVTAQARVDRTLRTVAGLETSHGFFYNWYSPSSGQKLTVWPETGAVVDPFLSSVDNGWLATALMVAESAMPAERTLASSILSHMDFAFFRNDANGLLKGGFWPNPLPSECVVNGGFTCFDFGTFVTEPRIATYIGISQGQLPATDYFRGFRTFPNTCDWSWQKQQPQGVTETYLGVNVFEGHYTYRGMNLVPSWGGSMFEALMPTLFVPEAQWGPHSWAINHPLYVQSQIQFGLDEAKYGYWGFSPSSDPYVSGGYQAYGQPYIGMNGTGYPSDEDNTMPVIAFDSCPGRDTTSIPSSYGRGVVTPHASFLALQFAPDAALANLAKLRANFQSYGWGGFFDAIGVRDGAVAKRYLALDQGMIMPAVENFLLAGQMQRYFSNGQVATALRPLMEMEHFTAGPASGDPGASR